MSQVGAQSPSDSIRSTVGVRRWRLLTAARVFALSVALGLTVTSDAALQSLTLFLVLCAVAITMSLSVPLSRLRWVAPSVEAALTSLLLVPNSEATAPLLVYLVIPPFVAGVRGGVKTAVITAAIEPLVAVVALLGGRAGALSAGLERVAPWMLVGLGLGLLGSWMHRLDTEDAGDQAGYESAHRLLGQLRAVSRRLSSGLDTTALAEQMLSHAMGVMGAERAVVLVTGDGRGLRTLAGKGASFLEDLERDESVEECRRSEHPQKRLLAREGEPDRHRTVAPLRVGTRVIGVVVVDAALPPSKGTANDLRSYLDEHSLRLEAALLFDEIRSTATHEERNRLAREIHDGIAQEIASLGYLVDDLAANAPEAEDVARELRREFTRVVSELRLSIFDLRSNVSPHGGLGLALSDYAREVGKRSGMTVHLALTEQPGRLHITVETELLRIAQEAITNARKHAYANNLWVTLNTESPIIMLRIEDDGIGAAQLRDHHYGLRIMRERANRLGGELTVSERPRGGTTVMVAVWPSTNTTTGEDDEYFSPAR